MLSPGHKRSSPALNFSRLLPTPLSTPNPPFHLLHLRGLTDSKPLKLHPKRNKHRASSIQQHHYSTSVSTAADSTQLDLTKPDKYEDSNVIQTPTSHRVCNSITNAKDLNAMDEDLGRYSSTQIAGKNSLLDYIQCETLALPFYNVTPSRRLPKTQKKALSMMCCEEDMEPNRSLTPRIDRVLHSKYLQNTQTDVPCLTPKPRRQLSKPPETPYMACPALNLPETASIRRRFRRHRSDKPVFLPSRPIDNLHRL